MSIKLVTDSSANLPNDIIKSLDLSIVSLNVIIDDVSYLENEMNLEEFYTKLLDSDNLPTSSQPSIDSLYKAFNDLVKKGHEVIGVFLSSKMSGTVSAAQLVKNMILEETPDAKIEIIDSESTCMEMGFLVTAAAKAALQGESMDKVLEIINKTKKCTRFLFVPQTLEFLKRGGRIGNASALLAEILKIKPVLTVKDGVAASLSKIRTQKKAIEYIQKIFEQDINAHGLKDAVIHHIHCLDNATAFAKSIFSIAGRQLPIIPIAPVVGTHVGPGTLGIAYCTNEVI